MGPRMSALVLHPLALNTKEVWNNSTPPQLNSTACSVAHSTLLHSKPCAAKENASRGVRSVTMPPTIKSNKDSPAHLKMFRSGPLTGKENEQLLMDSIQNCLIGHLGRV